VETGEREAESDKMAERTTTMGKKEKLGETHWKPIYVLYIRVCAVTSLRLNIRHISSGRVFRLRTFMGFYLCYTRGMSCLFVFIDSLS